MNSQTPWILIAVIILLILLGVIAVYATKGKKREPNYYAFFWIGLIWLATGFPMGNWPMWALGLVFFITGLVNKDKWKKDQMEWKDMNQKDKKVKLLTVAILGVLVLAGLVAFLIVSKTGTEVEIKSEPVRDELIGGQRDEHGCLGPAGYSWNEEAGACIRVWELDENQKRAARMAMDDLGYKEGSTIIQVVGAECTGCYMVEVEQGRDRIKITLEDWIIKKQSLTPDECLELGGRTVNTVGGGECEDDEENIGEVAGFISPNICCKAK